MTAVNIATAKLESGKRRPRTLQLGITAPKARAQRLACRRQAAIDDFGAKLWARPYRAFDLQTGDCDSAPGGPADAKASALRL
jgi:hypothetical protein